MTDNLPVPDDLPYLNLSQSELDELRKSKKELTEYGKQRLKELIYKQDIHKMEDAAKDLVLENLTHEEMLEISEKREAENRPFYRFFAIEYFATGEGMSFWLKVCRNYQQFDDRDRDLERFVKFIGVGAEHYIHGLTQPTQEEFMTQYANLIPPYIVKMIERRDQPGFDWETHFHFNYS